MPIDQPAKQDAADGIADLSRGSDENRSLYADAGIVHQRRKPTDKKKESEQVHEEHEPHQRSDVAAALDEELLDDESPGPMITDSHGELSIGGPLRSDPG